MKTLYITLLTLIVNVTYSQVNCYIYPENSGEREACELSYKALEYPQGSKASQEIFDKAIAIGPKFDWAYYEKSVPYFKRGFLHEGIQILNKAIALKPEQYLWYRAYWYWQYRNYELCIKDLEAYYKLPRADHQQTTPGGAKDMRIILGLAYAKTNNIDKGIATILKCIESYDNFDDAGITDYHTLGVLYFKNKDYTKALEAFNNQLKIYNIVDTQYFMGLTHKNNNDIKQAEIHLKEALQLFNQPNFYRVPNAGYRVYVSDVEEELLDIK